MPNDEIVKGFQRLFRGRADAWGSVKGKCNKEQVTEQHYLDHLEGKTSLGIYPLLDDGTCYFCAVDLDEKDWQKALLIRGEFFKHNLTAYISFSKSKGYHIWVFAGIEPFLASDIRQVCQRVLEDLKIVAEVFPKQEKLDDITPLGNYINLPAFGALTNKQSRMFATKQMALMPIDEAIKKIVPMTSANVETALKNIPVMVPKLIPKTTAKGKKRKSKQPPCIEAIMAGMQAGARDEAAFALARHYLDQQYTEQEVLGLLLAWDKKNSPPLNDIKLLETKVKSAAKGYHFGCSSIQDNPLLALLCVKKENCDWLKEVTADKKKKGLIREQSFHESEDYIYEEIVQGEKAMFVAFNKQTGEVGYQPSIEYPEFAIVPIYSMEITEHAVTLPTGVDEYGSSLDLVEEIKKHIKEYVDISPTTLEFATWYVMMSWVYDRLATLSYLRFSGDTGTGKSRSLDVIGKLCYKPMMMAGAVTPAPIYRLIRKFRGTLILEEADFRDTTEKSEVVTILNSGFEKFRPVIRCSHDNPENLEILPCYGPKVFATRYSFSDIALEARCLSFTMEETDREDIPPILGDKFYDKTEKLRRKLLLWRLRNMLKIKSGDVEEIDLGPLEPRLKQIGLPFAVPFKDFPDVMDRFREFMRNYNVELRRERSDSRQGRVILTLFKLAAAHGRDYISSQMISNDLMEQKYEISKEAVGKILKSLHIKTSNRRIEGTRARYLDWENQSMKKILKRYVPEPDEYANLLDASPVRCVTCPEKLDVEF